MLGSPDLAIVLIFLPGLRVGHLAWAWAVLDVSHFFPSCFTKPTLLNNCLEKGFGIERFSVACLIICIYMDYLGLEHASLDRNVFCFGSWHVCL
jgi:hypothetical protein